MAFSPDGKTLASGSKDESVKLWRVQPKPESPSERIFPWNTFSLSSNGRWFSVFAGGRLTVGDTRTLRDVREFVPDSQDVATITAGLLDSSGQRLYLGYASGRIRAVELNTERDVFSMAGHGDAVTFLALSSDGRQLASTASDPTIRVQDAGTGQPIVTLTAAAERLNCLSFSQDGRLLAGGSHQDDILLWDLRTGAQRFRMTGHKGQINSLAFSPDGQRLASASWDGTAGVWDVATGQRIATFRGHLLGVNSVAFSPGGQRLAAGTGDGFIKLWNVADGQEVLTLVGHHNINQVAFLPGDETPVSVSLNSIQLWPAPTLREITELERRAPRTP